MEEAAFAAAGWGWVVEVFDEGAAESAVMEMAGDVGGEVIGEPAFLLGEEESEWGAFFLPPEASGEGVGHGLEHRHLQRAPEAARALVGTHCWDNFPAHAH